MCKVLNEWSPDVLPLFLPLAECGCNPGGSINGIDYCSTFGECNCKAFVEADGKCAVCKDGYYDLKDANIFGCSGKLWVNCCF